MKRSYDNSVSGLSSFSTVSGQISTGQMATKDATYMNTNMVNLQREDHTSLHGIETQFSQTRTLPIVGKTSRAEIALKSADIQTKCLPIFQPQVQVNPDPVRSNINRLIYEVGLSATWRNSMLDLPSDNTYISSLAITGVLPYASNPAGATATVNPDTDFSYLGESTFQNAAVSIPITDAYNVTQSLSLLPLAVTDTYLVNLFDYWRGKINPTVAPVPDMSVLRKTCLTPVVVPSVKAKIQESFVSNYLQYEDVLIILVDSTEGFSVGDRLRLFGCAESLNEWEPLNQVYTTVLAVIDYLPLSPSSSIVQSVPALVVDYQDLSNRIFVGGYVYTPAPGPPGPPGPPGILSSIQFIVADTSPFTIGETIIIAGAIDPQVNQSYVIASFTGTTGINCFVDFGTNPPTASSACYIDGEPNELLNGYVINQKVKNGGHIEFLTDETEFKPLQFIGTNFPYNGLVNLQYNTDTTVQPPLLFDSGFWRGYTGNSLDPFMVDLVVELTLTGFVSPPPYNQAFWNQVSSTYNGYYRILNRSNLGIYLSPISTALPINVAVDLTDCKFEMKLAPNFYTFDTRTDEIINPVSTYNKMTFMRQVGFTPTKELQIQSPTYPPTASIPSKTWTRAFTVSWDFSAYRNLTWQTQDLTSSLPRLPLVTQDFGADNGSSTYYNVYEINKFNNDCVNIGTEQVINDTTAEINNYEALSLDRQLATNFNAYKLLFQNAASNYVYNSTVGLVINVASFSASQVTFTVSNSTGFSPGQTLLASGFPSIAIPGTPPVLVPLDGVYTILSITGPTIVCNDPNGLPPFLLQPYTGTLVRQYQLGELAVTGTSATSLAFVAKRTSPPYAAIPTTPESTKSWNFLGYIPYQLNEPSVPFLGLVVCENAETFGAGILTTMTAVVTSWQVAPPTLNPTIFLSIASNTPNTNYRPTYSNLIPVPVFKTLAPVFHYNTLTYLLSVKYDGYGFGTINVYQPSYTQSLIALYDYTRQSWGNSGFNNADEWVTFESNSSFKFLYDNFPSYCTAYEDTLAQLRTGTEFPSIAYWVWDSTTSHDPRTDGQFYEISQTSESLSSCMSPVESIVVVSENIPVLEELSSPVQYLIDSDSSSFLNRSETVSLTNKIIGEFPFTHFSPYNVRSVVRYDANELHYCALLDTKLFKQLEYSLFYRHRITQQLVPLILSNYGSVNIKFVFRPIS